MAKKHRTPEGYARQLEYARSWRIKNREEITIKERERRIQRRQTALREYGGSCAKCGDRTLEHLVLVPTRYTGKERIGGTELYLKVAMAGYPRGYTVLCWNCKMARRRHAKESDTGR